MSWPGARGKGERPAPLAHPPSARPGSPLPNRQPGNAAGAVPTGLRRGVGSPSWRSDQNQAPQNINYCCFRSPNTGGCRALPRKHRSPAASLAFESPAAGSGSVTPRGDSAGGASHIRTPRGRWAEGGAGGELENSASPPDLLWIFCMIAPSSIAPELGVAPKHACMHACMYA